MKVSQFLCAGLALATLSACQLLPDRDGRAPASRTPPPIDRSGGPSPSRAGRQCLAQLGATGASFSPLPNVFDAPGCTRIDTVSLTDLQGDASRFAIANLGPVTCATAEAFAGWVRFGVDRAARAYLGSPLARIETMGSYSCRNVAGSRKRSAHARAEAIDIAAFVLEDGRRVSVQGDWNGGSAAEREFLRVVRKSACKRFGTVLSPDYNAAHADHFHLEVGDGSFCR
ncbi:extensin-like domain-containing protein [Alteriqipengyuania sp. 357]